MGNRAVEEWLSSAARGEVRGDEERRNERCGAEDDCVFHRLAKTQGCFARQEDRGNRGDAKRHGEEGRLRRNRGGKAEGKTSKGGALGRHRRGHENGQCREPEDRFQRASVRNSTEQRKKSGAKLPMMTATITAWRG